MRTVMEFVEVAQPTIEIDMPAGAEIIHVDGGGNQEGRVPIIAIFAVADDTAAMNKRRFAIAFTGQPAPVGRHVGTFIAGPYVHHVFEVA